jgi:hypothetical protein
MVDTSRLAETWYRWAPGFGGGEARVSVDGAVTTFSTDDSHQLTQVGLPG